MEGGNGWTVIFQWLQGQTTIAPQGGAVQWPFRASYVLLAKRFGSHTLSARYDKFTVDSLGADGYGAQSGHAWTAAYIFNADAHWRFTPRVAAGGEQFLQPGGVFRRSSAAD